MKAVVLFSGGLDSTVLVYHLLGQGFKVIGLTVDYGQKHGSCELFSAARIAKIAGIEHVFIDLDGCSEIFHGSALTSENIAIPSGHYEHESMKATVVPNRNMVLISLATACAISRGASLIGYAAHGGDRAIYPDCRTEFASAMMSAVELCDETKPVLNFPFILWSKADIVRYGHTQGVPLGLTYSCYRGGTTHCGECGTCTERREAFKLAGVTDETRYTAAMEAA